ncbi:MAG: hypothetical protein ACJAR2_002771 [Ilumatobacter sp.]|jgi:hypothetical protein
MVLLLPSDPDAPTVEHDDLREDLVAFTVSTSDVLRSNGALRAAIWASRRSEFEEMRVQSDRAVQLGVVGLGIWFGALQVHAWSHYEIGRFPDAIRIADEDIEQAYRLGDRSATILPLAVYAAVFMALGELDTVAIIRGQLPRRLTVLMIR